ncbi:hypothetical protein MY10362_006796 [Beauveria mimosiformis]
MHFNNPRLTVLCIEQPDLYYRASHAFRNADCHGVDVMVEQCDYNKAPKKLDTGVPKLICTVSDHIDKVWLIFNEDKPNQKTKEGRKAASLPQSATATYEIIGGQPGNGDFIRDESTASIIKKTYDDEVAKEARITHIFEAAKSSNSAIIHAPPNLMDIALELVKILAQGMSPDLILRPEEFCLVEDPLSKITLEKDVRFPNTKISKPACVCAEGSRTCGIPTENKSKAKIIEDGVQEKQIEAVFLRFKTPETHGAQPYEESGLEAGFFRAHNALNKVCPAQAYGYAPWCKSMSVGIENFLWFNDVDSPVDLAIVVVRSGNVIVHKLTKGVTLQKAYVLRARSFGSLDSFQHKGKVTAGAVISAHTGYSAANWHLDIAGVDRYDLHKETLAEAMDEFKEKEKDVTLEMEEDVAELASYMEVHFSMGDPRGEAARTPLKATVTKRIL